MDLSRQLECDTPGPDSHVHECPQCDGKWNHQRSCHEGQFAWCDTCTEDLGIGLAVSRHGRHVHYCVQCARTWPHILPCATLLRAVLPELRDTGSIPLG